MVPVVSAMELTQLSVTPSRSRFALIVASQAFKLRSFLPSFFFYPFSYFSSQSSNDSDSSPAIQIPRNHSFSSGSKLMPSSLRHCNNYVIRGSESGDNEHWFLLGRLVAWYVQTNHLYSLKLEAEIFSETLVGIYQVTRCHIPRLISLLRALTISVLSFSLYLYSRHIILSSFL